MLGRPIVVRLTEEDCAIARELGGGFVSGGARLALRAARSAGVALTLKMAALHDRPANADSPDTPDTRAPGPRAPNHKNEGGP